MRVYFDPKPIPDRRFDWTATDDDYEPGDPIGHGRVESEAVVDLLVQVLECE